MSFAHCINGFSPVLRGENLFVAKKEGADVMPAPLSILPWTDVFLKVLFSNHFLAVNDNHTFVVAANALPIEVVAVFRIFVQPLVLHAGRLA